LNKSGTTFCIGAASLTTLAKHHNTTLEALTQDCHLQHYVLLVLARSRHESKTQLHVTTFLCAFSLTDLTLAE